MSTDQMMDPLANNDEAILFGPHAPLPILHRLAAVRRSQGISRRVLAARLGITTDELRIQEETPDVSLSTLNAWAHTLRVPVTELVIEQDECLRAPRMARSQAARLMSVATKLRDRTRRRGIQRLAQTFVEQLFEIDPSLEAVADPSDSPGQGGSKRRVPPIKPLPESVFTSYRDADLGPA